MQICQSGVLEGGIIIKIHDAERRLDRLVQIIYKHQDYKLTEGFDYQNFEKTNARQPYPEKQKNMQGQEHKVQINVINVNQPSRVSHKHRRLRA